MTDPALTATLERPDRPPRLLTPARRKRMRRWWRRKPVNTLMVWLHRWPGLVLGLLLVVETTSGAVLLYNGDIFRAGHGELYRHTATASPISADHAIDLVDAAHPDFDASWVAHDSGVLVVGNSTYDNLWFVDPGTGHLNGRSSLDGGFMGWLVNLHDCGFTCEGYPWYSSWLAHPLWTDGPSFVGEVNRGGAILGVLGLLFLLLALSSLRIWWPGWRKLRSRTRVRTGKGRFARDYDLHNVVGIVALPFLLMWGLTGAAFEFPDVQKAWISITGGTNGPEEEFSLAAKAAPPGAAAVTFDQAVAKAEDVTDGSAQWIGRPTKDTPYWEIDLNSGYRSYAYRVVYHSDVYVLIDPHDVNRYKVLEDARGEPASNRFYEKYLEPTHFGWNVNGWWRAIWAALGLTPLVLMITGVSTWLFRRGVRKRRRAALLRQDPAVAPVDDLDAELIAGHVEQVDPEIVHAAEKDRA